MWAVILFTFVVLLVSSRVLKLLKGLKSVDHLPGFRCFFSPFAFPGMIVPHRSWNPGLSWTWHWRFFIYKQFKSETISLVPYILGPPIVYTSSLDVARQILTSSQFVKNFKPGNSLALWGHNVISSEHETYKRHRRIVGPAFSGGISPLVWEETSKTYKEILADEGWSEKMTVNVDRFDDYTEKLALILISRCAFGLPFPWTVTLSTRGESDLHATLPLVSSSVTFRSIAPRWLYKLPIKTLNKIEYAFTTLEGFMRSYIATQRANVSSQDAKSDLFARLIEANSDAENSKLALDDDELIGNVFAFLLAGHETTARSIAVTLALLALHQEEQDIAVEEIQRVLVDGRDPVFEDSEALSKVQACFLEAGRLFPAAFIVVRDTDEFVQLTTPTDNGDRTFVVAPGTIVVVDMVGICYNPVHFPDPEVYKPSRWYGVQESDVMFFGLGHRACLGRKFAMTEALCFLTYLLRDWVVSPLLRDGETAREWERRVLQLGKLAITLGVDEVPIKLTRRG